MMSKKQQKRAMEEEEEGQLQKGGGHGSEQVWHQVSHTAAAGTTPPYRLFLCTSRWSQGRILHIHTYRYELTN